MNNINLACNTAESTFDEAQKELNSLTNLEHKKEVENILKLIRDNLDNWKQELNPVIFFST